jgi:general secretion pathway protein J
MSVPSGSPFGAAAPRQAAAAGFTVLEMMVVLVILALVTTLAMQGLGYVLGQRERFVAFLQEYQSDVLRRTWFRQTAQGIFPGRSAHGSEFRGETSRWSGLTLKPLSQEAGIPRRVTLDLQRQGERVALLYREQAGPAWRLAEWPAASQPAFRYLDESGQWYRRWPPRSAKDLPQTPEAIRIAFDDGAGRREDWHAAITARNQPPVLLKDLLQ